MGPQTHPHKRTTETHSDKEGTVMPLPNSLPRKEPKTIPNKCFKGAMIALVAFVMITLSISTPMQTMISRRRLPPKALGEEASPEASPEALGLTFQENLAADLQ